MCDDDDVVNGQVTNYNSITRRISSNIQLLYTFEEGAGPDVHDASAIDTSPLDSTATNFISFSTGNNITGGYLITSCFSPSPNCAGIGIASKVTLTKIAQAVATSGEVTVEVWFKTTSSSQNPGGSPARIFTFGTDTTCTGFNTQLLQQNKDVQFGVNVKNSLTQYNCKNSIGTSTIDAVNAVNNPVQAVIRYSQALGGIESLQIHSPYLSYNTTYGTSFFNSNQGLSVWNPDWNLMMANDNVADRRWNGQIYLMAMYSRYLSDAEVFQNYVAGTNMQLIKYDQFVRIRPIAETTTPSAIVLDVFDRADRPSLQFKLVYAPIGIIYYMDPTSNLVPLTVGSIVTITASNHQYTLYYESPSSLSPTNITVTQFSYKIFGRDVASTPDNSLNGANTVTISIQPCALVCGGVAGTGSCSPSGGVCNCIPGFLNFNCETVDICYNSCVNNQGVCTLVPAVDPLQKQCICLFGYQNSNCSRPISNPATSTISILQQPASGKFVADSSLVNDITVVVTVKDMFGSYQLLPGDNVTVRLQPQKNPGNIKFYTPTFVGASSGTTFTVDITRTTIASIYNVTVWLNGVVLSAAAAPSLKFVSFLYVPNSVSPPNCTYGVFHSYGFVTLPPNNPAFFDLNSFDVYGNRRLYGVDTNVGMNDFVVTLTFNSGLLNETVYTTNPNPNPLNYEVNNNNVLSITWFNSGFPSSSYYLVRFLTSQSGSYIVNVFANVTSTSSYALVQLPGFPKTVSRTGPVDFNYVIPDVGKIAGGTFITLSGSNFFTSAWVGSPADYASYYTRCVFNNTISNTTTAFISVNKIVCKTPSSVKSGTAILRLTNDDGITLSAASWLYYYYDPLVVMISPTSAPLIGGTIVTVTPPLAWLSAGNASKMFYKTAQTQPQCIFDVKVVNATLVDPFTATCVMPPFYGISSSVTVNFDFTLNGEEFSSDFMYPRLYFDVINSASSLCRTSSELSIGVSLRQQAGLPYFGNLALNSANVFVAQGNPIVYNNTLDLRDGDRCCNPTAQRAGGHQCGVAFQQQANGAATVESRLSVKSYISEVVTSWFQTCRNVPKKFDLYYWDYLVTNNWKIIKTRYIDSATAVAASSIPEPCSSIPSDEGEVSICIDFFDAVLSDRFLLSFNNSASLLGSYPSATDGGWLFEVELHGIASTTPYSLNASTSVVYLSSNFGALVPQISVAQKDYAGNILLGSLSNIYVRASGFSGGQIFDPTTTFIVTPNGASGLANFNNIKFNAPPTGSYTLEFYIPYVVDTGVGFTCTVVVIVQIGPAAYLAVDAPNSFQVVSKPSLLLPTFKVRAYDNGRNFVGANDTVTGRYINVTLNSTNPASNFASTTLSGTLSVMMVNGLAIFSNARVLSPAIGSYTLALSGGTLTKTFVYFTVSAGDAALADANPRTISILCYATSYFPAIDIGIYDSQHNFVNSYVSVVTVTMSPSPGLLQGALIRSIYSGSASFDDLSMVNPPFGSYYLQFDSPGLTGTVVNVTVDIGPPASIATPSEQSLSRSYPSASTVMISPPLVVRLYDASGAFVNGTDTTSRLSKLTLNSAASGPHPPTLMGSTTLTMVDGEVVFSNLYVNSPVIGTYVYTIFVQQDASADPFVQPSFQFSITIGQPFALRSDVADPGLRVYSALKTTLQSISIYTVDAGGNIFGVQDPGSRTITAALVSADSSLSFDGTSSPSSLLMAVNTGNVVFPNLILAAPKTSVTWNYCAQEGGTCSFTGTKYVRYGVDGGYSFKTATGSIQCTYTAFGIDPDNTVTRECYFSTTTSMLNFTSSITSVANVLVPIEIYPGSPASLQIDPVQSTIQYCGPSVASYAIRSIAVKEYDVANSYVGSYDTVQRAVVASFVESIYYPSGNISTASILGGSTSALVKNGNGVMSELTLQAPIIGTHILLLTVANVGSLQLSITVFAGPPAMLTIVSPVIDPLAPIVLGIVADLPLPVFVIGMLDAGRNMWNITAYSNLPSDRLVNLAVTGNGVTPSTVSGPNVQSLASATGQATFTSLVMPTPPLSLLTLTFTNGDLLGGDVSAQIQLIPGAAYGLSSHDVQTPGGYFMSASLSTNSIVTLQVKLIAVDVSGSDLSLYNTTLFANSFDLYITSDSAGVGGLNIVGGNDAALGVMNSPSMTVSISFLCPQVGSFDMAIIANPFLRPLNISLDVFPGVQASLGFIDNLPVKVPNNEQNPWIGQAMRVQVYDVCGNVVTSSAGLLLQVAWIAVTPGAEIYQAGNASDFLATTFMGQATFPSISLIGVPGSSYRLEVFTAAGGAATGIYNHSYTASDITITPCRETGPPFTAPNGKRCECDVGYELDDISKTCFPCSRNTYKDTVDNVNKCQPCEVSKETVSIASTSSDECMCVPGFYSVAVGSSCLSCPVGGICHGGLDVETSPGYWRGDNLNSNNYTMHKCLGTACMGQAGCAPGYIGPLCGTCARGYSGFGATICDPCPNPAASAIMMLILLAVWIFIIVMCSRTVIYNTLLKEGNKDLDAVVVLKLMINYAQSIAFLAAYQLPWSRPINFYMEIASSFTMSPNIVPIDCAFHISFYYYFLWYLLLPFILIVIATIIVVTVHKYQKAKSSISDGSSSSWFIPPTAKSDHKEPEGHIFMKYAITGLIIVIYIIHPAVSRQAFEVFSCQRIDGKEYLSESMTNFCTTKTHLFWEVMSATVLQLWIFGIPFYIFYTLIVNRYRLKEFEMRLRFQFLIAGYNLRYYYYEGFAILRRVLLVIILVFGRGQPIVQVTFGLLIMMLSISIMFQLKPYEKITHMLLDFWAMVTVYVTLIGGALLYSQGASNHPEINTLVTSVVIIMNLLVIGLFFILVTRFLASPHVGVKMDGLGQQIFGLKSMEKLRQDHKSAIVAQSTPSNNSVPGKGLNAGSEISKDSTRSRSDSATQMIPGTGTMTDSSTKSEEGEVTLFVNRSNDASTLVSIDDLQAAVSSAEKEAAKDAGGKPVVQMRDLLTGSKRNDSLVGSGRK